MSSSTLNQVLEEVKALTAEEQQKVRELLESLHSESKPKMTIAEVEQKMLEDGFLTHLPSSVRDRASFKKRKLIEVKGKPLSETIIEERR